MRNWSVDVTKLKENLKKYIIWKLEQRINFGLEDEKLSESQLRKYWPNLTIDPAKRSYLAQLLWPKAS